MEREACIQEAKIQLSMHHPSIVRCRETMMCRTGENLYMVMEVAAGGDLRGHLKNAARHASVPHAVVDEREAADGGGGGILLGLARLGLGLEHMHHNKLVHRDIKAENILCCATSAAEGATADGLFPAPSQWKLADFGITRVLGTGLRDVANTFCGTPVYMSPEIVNRQGYTHGCDVWALGCVVYELIALRHPFAENVRDMAHLHRKINAGAPPLPPIARCGAQVRRLLSSMLASHPTARPTMAAVLKHPALIHATRAALRRAGREATAALDICRAAEDLTHHREALRSLVMQAERLGFTPKPTPPPSPKIQDHCLLQRRRQQQQQEGNRRTPSPSSSPTPAAQRRSPSPPMMSPRKRSPATPPPPPSVPTPAPSPPVHEQPSTRQRPEARRPSDHSPVELGPVRPERQAAVAFGPKRPVISANLQGVSPAFQKGIAFPRAEAELPHACKAPVGRPVHEWSKRMREQERASSDRLSDRLLQAQHEPAAAEARARERVAHDCRTPAAAAGKQVSGDPVIGAAPISDRPKHAVETLRRRREWGQPMNFERQRPSSAHMAAGRPGKPVSARHAHHVHGQPRDATPPLCGAHRKPPSSAPASGEVPGIRGRNERIVVPLPGIQSNRKRQGWQQGEQTSQQRFVAAKAASGEHNPDAAVFKVHYGPPPEPRRGGSRKPTQIAAAAAQPQSPSPSFAPRNETPVAPASSGKPQPAVSKRTAEAIARFKEGRSRSPSPSRGESPRTRAAAAIGPAASAAPKGQMSTPRIDAALQRWASRRVRDAGLAREPAEIYRNVPGMDKVLRPARHVAGAEWSAGNVVVCSDALAARSGIGDLPLTPRKRDSNGGAGAGAGKKAPARPKKCRSDDV